MGNLTLCTVGNPSAPVKEREVGAGLRGLLPRTVVDGTRRQSPPGGPTHLVAPASHKQCQAPYADQELTYEALVNLGAAYRAQGWVGEAEDMFRVAGWG